MVATGVEDEAGTAEAVATGCGRGVVGCAEEAEESVDDGGCADVEAGRVADAAAAEVGGEG